MPGSCGGSGVASTMPKRAAATVAGNVPTLPQTTRPLPVCRTLLLNIPSVPSDAFLLTTTTSDMSARNMTGSGKHADIGSSSAYPDTGASPLR